jgi:putative ABC transport system permease protein
VIQNATFVPFPPEVTDRVRDTEGVGLVVRHE